MQPKLKFPGNFKASVALIACFVLIVTASGCASTDEAVTDSDIVIKAYPIVAKEGDTVAVPVIVTDLNPNCPIYAVSIRDVTGLQLIERNTEGGILPGDTVKIECTVEAPDVDNAPSNATIKIASMVTADYTNKITKEVTVPVTILPDVGFLDAKLTAKSATVNAQNLEVTKGSDVYVVCTVKNFGNSNIDEKTLWVKASVENEEIGGNTSAWIENSMTYEGVSEEKRLKLHVKDDAPNGITKVILQVKIGNDVIDEKQLSLRIKL